MSRNTVIAAYEELTALNLIEGLEGSGTRVIAAPRKRVPVPLPDWPILLRESRYPRRAVHFSDTAGNNMYVYRTGLS